MKKLLLGVGIFCAFLGGYSVANHVFAYTGTIHGRAEHRGYFTNTLDSWGNEVLRPVYGGEAIRPDVNSANSFITFIKHTKLDIDNNGSGDTRDKTGAAFIIHTMIGTPIGQRNRPPTAAQIAEWEARVRYAEATNRVTWRTNLRFTINSYWQGAGSGSNPNDNAFYDETATMPSIVFRNASGAVVYALKWECGNPVGTGSLPDDANFSMSGRSTVNNASPLPGQTIQFRHYVRNNGPQGTSPTGIFWAAFNSITGATSVGSSNSGSYASGQEKSFTEDVVVPANYAPGSQICRQVGYDPTNSTGGRHGRGAPVCATVRYDFGLTPTITIGVNGSPPAGSTAEQGDTITFTYAVNNNGTTASQSANCTIYGRTVNGSYTPPTPPNSSSAGGYTAPGTGCPRVFPANTTTTLVTETVNNAASNTTICRSLFVNPATPDGENRGTEVCVRVVARPYLKVYGGDISAGGGFESAPGVCTNNANAAVTAWNKRTNGYAGAGAQYAVFALEAITDFASSQNAGPSTAAPTGLSFANTSASAPSGDFGGDFGSAPCIADYYGAKPASTGALGSSINVSPLGSGSYARTGNATITGGNVNPGNRMTLYIDGDVHITGNITYPGNWSYNSIPLFQLVVQGNIYIAPGVSQLDGIYIAQPDGASGGTIYTCATGMTPLALSGPLYTSCNNRLTVNGAFMARSVEFLRTRGTLSQSTQPNEINNIAEVFNFNPTLWIPQPAPVAGSADNYDAITSLPPIL